MSSKDLDNISKKISNLKFKRQYFGGVSEEDVWEKIKDLSKDYEDAYKDLGEENPKIVRSRTKRNDKKLNDKREAARRKTAIIMLGIKTVMILLLLVVIFGIFIGVTPMNNGDMYPKISSGDLLIYSKIGSSYKKLDVVVIKKNGEKHVGRVVAVPGDTVNITADSKLYINDEIVSEDGIFYVTGAFLSDVKYPLTLGDDEYFILGDYREAATDSRIYGPVSKKEIKGRVKEVIRRKQF